MMIKTKRQTAYGLELDANNGSKVSYGKQQMPDVAPFHRTCGLHLKTGIRGGIAFELDAIEMGGNDLNGPTRKG